MAQWADYFCAFELTVARCAVEFRQRVDMDCLWLVFEAFELMMARCAVEFRQQVEMDCAWLNSRIGYCTMCLLFSGGFFWWIEARGNGPGQMGVCEFADVYLT
ncbi:hypothetical protein FPQ18DRAFT_402348 [Pyronema domesticum]|uniref:Uncharacterized protein n=1 Tax=Pyronema omphalodes (strain CBS 100304) TaxID=1076935 RepID=U4L6M0_PYROM|nr:hypothetical protein FPQ18DRAFT_402348 [Pyronema domesticum]CCX12125.1 Protein of unknown function [Pyronema omphalodes CBS 100304]